MTPFVRTLISDAEVALFEKIRNAILKLPDIDLGTDEKMRPVVLSCHILARAVARVFRLRSADGFFHPNFQHSWVLSPDGHIFDVYPVGILGGPIMMEGKTGCSPARFCYARTKSRFYQGRFSTKSFRTAVRKVAAELRKAATK